MNPRIKVLMITTEWPTKNHPAHAPFLVRQVELLRAHEVIVDVFHFRSAGNPFNYIKALWKARQFFKNNYDLIHAQWGHSSLPVLFSYLPLVITFRGSDLQGIVNNKGNYTLKGKLLKLLSVLGASRADAIILVSKSLARFIPSNKSYSVIPSGINLNLFKPLSQRESRQRLGLKDEMMYILFAGNPSRTEKRYQLALESVALLSVKTELIYAENEPIDKMPLYMNAADVLLLTSMHEGSPNVVREALACNTPVVSVDVGDVRERISNIPGCYICDSRPVDIAHALEKVLSKAGEPFEGRKFVQSFDEEIMTREIMKVYRSVL